LFLTGLVLAHAGASWSWLGSDNRPPLWDMALHQTAGLRFHDLYAGVETGVADGGWWSITGAYPPFYHHLLAAAFLLGRDHHLAVWANLPATLVLVFGTYLLGCRLFSRSVGVLSAVVLMGFPYMAWMSRETVIDYTLAAVIVGAIVCLDYSDGFRKRRWSLAFGFVSGLAALTKWIGPAFLVVPTLWCVVRESGESTSRRVRNLLDAAILGGFVTLTWYLRKLPEIHAFLKANTAIGAAEGEPPVFSLQSAVYYLRLLEGEQVHAVFFLSLCAGLVFVLHRGSRAGVLLLLWIAGSYALLTLLRTKDPRFTIPYLPAVALLCTCWVPQIGRVGLRRAVTAALVGLAAGHFLLASFGWSRLPVQVLVASGYQGTYSWDWRLYSQQYQGLLGAPVRADWPQRAILGMVAGEARPGETVRVGVVPDLPRFNHENLRLEARLLGLPVEVVRIFQLGPAGVAQLRSLDFLIVAEGEQGMVWTTESNELINDYVFARPEDFTILSFAMVPGGPPLRVYRVEGF
jgi:4-amino-4-deoxy-L-arabinose transferase-like glycosyltransferase